MTDKQKKYIRDIANQLGIEEPHELSASEANDWIQAHKENFDKVRRSAMMDRAMMSFYGHRWEY